MPNVLLTYVHRLTYASTIGNRVTGPLRIGVFKLNALRTRKYLTIFAENWPHYQSLLNLSCGYHFVISFLPVDLIILQLYALLRKAVLDQLQST